MNRPFTNPHPQAGFTYLEMAVVLTVIGLIAGGIVVVRDLIRNAQVQSVINDEDRYKKAIQLFKEKYNYLPGDMPTATNFWGAEASCPTVYSIAEAVPKSATCNGDGNGRIDTFAEAMRAWQQLADAGFIQGEYSGIQGNANANSLTIDTDVPASKVPSCGWMMGFIPSTSPPTAGGFNILFQQGTYLALVSGGTDQLYPPCLTPTESYEIDTKIDDGLASSGNVTDGYWPFIVTFMLAPNGGGAWQVTTFAIGQHSIAWPCTTPWPTYAQYNTTASGIFCDPFFYTGL